MKKSLLLSFIFVFALVVQVLAQNRTVTGKVTDQETGQGLPGVTVLVKGTSSGTATSVDGGFTISVPSNDAVLVFRYVGYDNKEVAVGTQSTISVQLGQSSKALSEVVIVGYSESQQQKITSSVAEVGSERIESVALPDVNQIIQGRAPGVLSTVGSGQPGAGANIRIRGTGSISAGRAPLYVIDGVIIESGDYTRNNPTADLLSTLNPNDIESVNILKDATATALYGARAANGVVVINTKRGKAGKTTYTVRSQYGQTVRNNTNDFRLLTSEELTAYDRRVLANSGYGEATQDFYRPLSNSEVNTDWIDAAFQTGTTQNHEVSASGGNDKTRFFFSAGYFNQEGILIGSEFSRYSTRLNLDNNPSDKFSFGVNLNVSYTDMLSASPGNQFNSPLLGSYTMLPWDRIRDPETGELFVGDTYESFTQDNFVRSSMLNPTTAATLRGIGNIRGRYEILPGLSYKLVLGVDYTGIKEEDYTDPTTPDGFDSQGRVTNIFGDNITLTAQNVINYSKIFNDVHGFDALVGYEVQNFNREAFDVSGTGFASGKLRNIGTAAKAESIGGTATEYTFLSYLGQINYNYDRKYYLIANARRDGSSRFGANNRWANFGSVGVSWVASNESFLQDNSVLTNLRIRTSYGSTGNAEIGNFPARGLYSFAGAYGGNPASSPSQIESPDLRWEKNISTNVGVDFGLFNRVDASVDLYLRKSEDLLLAVPISSTSGFTTINRNIGEVQNKGIEFTVSTQNLVGEFNWTTDFNISANRSKVSKLNEGADIPNGTQIIREGEPIRSFYLREWAGADPATGAPRWKDGKGGYTSSYSAAPRTIVGNAEPDFYGGLTNTFRYKGLELSAFFYFVQGGQVYNQTRSLLESDGTRFGMNQSAAVLDHWMEPGDISSRPKPSLASTSSTSASTRWLEDGSYVRLRNVVLAYNLPSHLISKAKLSSVRVYAQGQNLLTFTDYSGFDPELAEDGTEWFRYPNGKSLTFGVDFGF